MSETADTLRAWAREALERARKAKDAGDYAQALKHLDFAAACEAKAAGIGVDSRSHVVHDGPVTSAEAFSRRVSSARAQTDPPDALVRAIVEDPAKRWRSATDYAKRRLHISKATFHNYRNGITPPTRAVDKKVRADFPSLSWAWPKSPVD